MSATTTETDAAGPGGNDAVATDRLGLPAKRIHARERGREEDGAHTAPGIRRNTRPNTLHEE